MKRSVSIFVSVLLLLVPLRVWAAVPDYSGGVNNEYEYEEYVFLTGEPVKFTGTLKMTESESKDKKTVSYRFTLKPSDKTTAGKFDRQMTYVTSYTARDDKGQTIAKTSLSKMKETINIGLDQFELKDYQFSKSDVIDNRPVADFYNGNFIGRKYYTVNRDQGEIVVDISGGDVGYENFWGNTQTQIINNVIEVTRRSGNEDITWQGTVKVQASDSTTKVLKYSENEAGFSSIDGGHMKVTRREMVSKLDYSLPRMKDGIPDQNKTETGTLEIEKSMVPRIERLIVPKFRDIGGTWAEEDIKKLYSLDVFDDSSQFFVPGSPMSRLEFTKAVMKACNIRPAVPTKNTAVRRNKTPEVSPFTDVDITSPDYQYIKDAVSKGIILGTSKGLFMPAEPLTRAQAIVILIRALGFESKAPAPGFYTSFSDDSSIPSWAKDSIYIAKEMGLITGDNYNNVNADKALNRAEASVLLVRFLRFLENDLQKDYRENIILYN